MRMPASEPAWVLPINNVFYLLGARGESRFLRGARSGLGMAEPAGNETPSGAIFGKESIY